MLLLVCRRHFLPAWRRGGFDKLVVFLFGAAPASPRPEFRAESRLARVYPSASAAKSPCNEKDASLGRRFGSPARAFELDIITLRDANSCAILQDLAHFFVLFHFQTFRAAAI